MFFQTLAHAHFELCTLRVEESPRGSLRASQKHAGRLAFHPKGNVAVAEKREKNNFTGEAAGRQTETQRLADLEELSHQAPEISGMFMMWSSSRPLRCGCGEQNLKEESRVVDVTLMKCFSETSSCLSVHSAVSGLFPARAKKWTRTRRSKLLFPTCLQKTAQHGIKRNL